MNFNKLLFSDIMQDKILYYDKDVEEACFDICNTLKIDFLPDYDSKHYYELIDNSFVKKNISKSIKVNVDDKIFNNNQIQKFLNNKHNVLFVFSGKILKGIVHFADYNKNVIIKNIQDDVLTFELNLREFLVLNGKSNKDILDYFEYKISKKGKNDRSYILKKLERHRRYETLKSSLGAFQHFELLDLLQYCNSPFSGILFKTNEINNKINLVDENIINSLRNTAMHGKNPIEIDLNLKIYSVDSLLTLKISVETLAYYNSILELNINKHKDYTLTRKLENINKLKIIHEHHPNSLKYFIGH